MAEHYRENGTFKFNFLAVVVVFEISGVHKLFNCLRNLAPSYLMNMCQSVTSNLHRRRLRSVVRGGLIVPPTKTVCYGPCSFAVAGPST